MLRNIAKLLPVLLVAVSLGALAYDAATVKKDKSPSKLPSQDLQQATPMPYNIQLPPTRPAEEHVPNTMHTEAEIAEAVDFVVHVERQLGRRILREVLAIRGYDRDAKRFLIEPVFEVKHATA